MKATISAAAVVLLITMMAGFSCVQGQIACASNDGDCATNGNTCQKWLNAAACTEKCSERNLEDFCKDAGYCDGDPSSPTNAEALATVAFSELPMPGGNCMGKMETALAMCTMEQINDFCMGEFGALSYSCNYCTV